FDKIILKTMSGEEIKFYNSEFSDCVDILAIIKGKFYFEV
ncbi:transcriptional regulator, XRE family, partial [Campylobacter jejuni]|nr:transcriptional regulator, XRE family [Campylobacter jejuni]